MHVHIKIIHVIPFYFVSKTFNVLLICVPKAILTKDYIMTGKKKKCHVKVCGSSHTMNISISVNDLSNINASHYIP